MLYHTLLHEIGHLQVVLPKSSNPKRKFADETLAEEFAKTWRKRLWAEHFAHPDPVHNAPDDEELAALEQGWSGGHLCYRRGLDLDRRGHRREAVRALQEAISHYPNHALALERLGGLVYAGYAGEEEPECFVLAASLCRRALAQDPMLCHATTVLGMALYRLGQHDSARSAFQRAAVIDPYQYIAKTVYAEHLGYWGEYDEAERLFEKILAKEPRHGMALLHYGGMLLYRTEGGDEGSTRRAIELLQRALAEGSGHACHYDLGIAYFRLGDRESAVRHMEEAVRLAADYRDAADLLAEWRAAREKI